MFWCLMSGRVLSFRICWCRVLLRAIRVLQDTGQPIAQYPPAFHRKDQGGYSEPRLRRILNLKSSFVPLIVPRRLLELIFMALSIAASRKYHDEDSRRCWVRASKFKHEGFSPHSCRTVEPDK